MRTTELGPCAFPHLRGKPKNRVWLFLRVAFYKASTPTVGFCKARSLCSRREFKYLVSAQRIAHWLVALALPRNELEMYNLGVPP